MTIPIPISAAIGCFDGLHLGHRKVLEAAINRRGCRPCAISFEPHPLEVMCPGKLQRLTTGAHQAKLLKQQGIDEIFALDFAGIKDMEPEEFVEQILKNRLNISFISCGYNYRFGRGARADAGELKRLCECIGIRAEIVPQVCVGGEPVSSSAVRRLLKGGQIAGVNRFLGRAYSYDLPVVGGRRVGRTLGWPTINQHFERGMCLPKFGVYATLSNVGGQKLPGVTNIGVRPTVGADRPLSETYIFGFDGDLYGRNIEVELIEFLRPEQSFGSLAELKSAVERDAARALTLLSQYL